MRGQGRAGGRERREGTLVGARAESLDPHATLSASAREAASYVLSTCNDHRFRYEKGRTVLSPRIHASHGGFQDGKTLSCTTL